MSLKKICSWCQKELEGIEDSNTGITHGICQSCAKQLKYERLLRPEHLAAGLSIVEDDHVLCIRRHGRDVAFFSVHTSRDSILQEADKYLVS